jgi:hypothetical protein
VRHYRHKSGFSGRCNVRKNVSYKWYCKIWSPLWLLYSPENWHARFTAVATSLLFCKRETTREYATFLYLSLHCSCHFYFLPVPFLTSRPLLNLFLHTRWTDLQTILTYPCSFTFNSVHSAPFTHTFVKLLEGCTESFNDVLIHSFPWIDKIVFNRPNDLLTMSSYNWWLCSVTNS